MPKIKKKCNHCGRTFYCSGIEYGNECPERKYKEGACVCKSCWGKIYGRPASSELDCFRKEKIKPEKVKFT